MAALLDAYPPVWTWWKRADDGRTTLGFPAAAIVDVGESGEVTPNQWSTLLWPDTIEVLPLGESAAVEIGTWSGTLAARQTPWEGVTPRPRVKRFPLPVTLATLGTVVMLCCGGTTAVSVLAGGTPKPATPASPATAAATSAPAPSPTEVSSTGPAPADPSPPPATTAPAAPAPAATTRQPAPPPPAPGKPPAPAPTTPAYQHGVHPGAFCSPRGAYGYTVNGVLMQCKPSATDSRNRWRAA